MFGDVMVIAQLHYTAAVNDFSQWYFISIAKSCCMSMTLDWLTCYFVSRRANKLGLSCLSVKYDGFFSHKNESILIRFYFCPINRLDQNFMYSQIGLQVQ
jgi:hypothetical protein